MSQGQLRQLWGEIKTLFGIELPAQSFTEGHSSPFGFVSDAMLNPTREVAAWSCRGGTKTLCCAILACLQYREHDNLHSRILSGSEDQGRHLYEYIHRFAPQVLGNRVEELGRNVSKIAGGRLELLSASEKRVRGARVPHLYLDELDEMHPDIIEAAIGMLNSRYGIPSRVVYASTWHHAHGPMGELVTSAEEQVISVHKWGVWEAIAHCPRERHQDGRGCQDCPLGPVCLTKARERHPLAKIGIASKAHGLIAIDDAIKQFRMWSREAWEAEAECKRPSLSGMVYSAFNPAVHVRPDLDFDDDLPIFRAIDWGLNTFACLWLQVTKEGIVRIVDEMETHNRTLAQNAAEINERDKGVRPIATYCDPAGRSRNDHTGTSAIDEFRSYGIRAEYNMTSWAREVHNGINQVRAALRAADGTTRLFVSGRCPKTIRAFQSYRLRMMNNEYIDEPIKPQECDHLMDSLRYWFVNRGPGRPRNEAKTLGYSG